MGWFNFAQGGGGSGGSGDVVGPASSTDNAIARYDGTTGKLLKDSGVTVADGLTGAVVVGSTGATDDAIIIADGTGGSTIAASAATLTAAGSLTIPSAEQIKWSTDTGLERNGAGQVRITDASTGERDLLVRYLYLNAGSLALSQSAYGLQVRSTPAGNAFVGVQALNLSATNTSGNRLVIVQSDSGSTIGLGLASGAKVAWNSSATEAATTTPDTTLDRVAAGQVSVTNGTIGAANNIKIATTTVNLSGATSTASALFPAACIRLGITARVTTTATSGDGGTDMNIGDGTDADRYGATIAFAAGTTVTMANATADPSSGGWVGATGDVVFTCNGGTFSGGVVRVCAHYIDLTAPTS